MTHLAIIAQNPYRILGVVANATTKERTANLGKMKAFLNVGRTVNYDLDLTDMLPAPERTAQSVAQAQADINLPQDQLRHALFWFVKADSVDEVALNHLIGGNVAKAMEIFSKRNTFSGLHNAAVLSMIQDDNATAISKQTAMIHDSDMRNAFVRCICGDAYTATEDELAHIFIDNLLNEQSSSGVAALVKIFDANDSCRDDSDYVKNKAAEPTISAIETAIATAKNAAKTPTAQFNAGTKLMNDTKTALCQAKQLLGSTSLQYQQIADKLANTILQCGINYYNESEDDDAAHKAMTLQEYALQIAVGPMVKDRCKENYDILKKIIDELPPAEVMADSKAVVNALKTFSTRPNKISYALTLLRETRSHLQAIAAKLGRTNTFYLNLSTTVVAAALNNLIDEVNRTQNLVSIAVNSGMTTGVSDMFKAVDDAWSAIQLMDNFDMDNNFKSNRYNPNRSTLYNMYQQQKRFMSATSGNNYTSTSSSNSGSGCSVLLGIAIFISITITLLLI